MLNMSAWVTVELDFHGLPELMFCSSRVCYILVMTPLPLKTAQNDASAHCCTPVIMNSIEGVMVTSQISWYYHLNPRWTHISPSGKHISGCTSMKMFYLYFSLFNIFLCVLYWSVSVRKHKDCKVFQMCLVKSQDLTELTRVSTFRI